MLVDRVKQTLWHSMTFIKYSFKTPVPLLQSGHTHTHDTADCFSTWLLTDVCISQLSTADVPCLADTSKFRILHYKDHSISLRNKCPVRLGTLSDYTGKQLWLYNTNQFSAWQWMNITWNETRFVWDWITVLHKQQSPSGSLGYVSQAYWENTYKRPSFPSDLERSGQ